MPKNFHRAQRKELGEMRLYEALASMLKEVGADAVFGVMGDANMKMISAFSASGGRYVKAVHETGAITMADAYYRMSGSLGIATVTHGPGLTNSLTGLTEAARSRSAVLVISGDIPAEPGHDQLIDIRQIALTAGALFDQIFTPRTAARDFSRAVRRAIAGRLPLVLDVPAEMLEGECEVTQMIEALGTTATEVPDEGELDDALGVLLSARRPVLIAGRGAIASEATQSMVELAERTGAFLGTSVLGKGAFEGQTRNIGIVGSLATEVAQTILAESDCIVSFGASLNYFTSMNGDLLRGKRVIHVDLEPGAMGNYSRVDEAIIGDALAVAESMNRLLDEAGVTTKDSSWVESYLDELLSHAEDLPAPHNSAGTVDIRHAAASLAKILPDEIGLVSDVGRFNAGTWPFIDATNPRDFLGMSSFGSIGLGLAGAIGAAVARPGLPIVLLVGDGGLMMHLGELITAVRERLPIIIVVWNDDAYGFEYFRLERYGFDPHYSKNYFPDFAPIAEAFSYQTKTVRSLTELERTAELWRDGLNGPILIDIKLDADHNIAH